MTEGLIQSDLKHVPLFFRGKVRDVYDLGDKLLIVATDRISAFDYVLPTPIPDKGKVLTKISVFWFDYLKDIVQNHLIEYDVEKYPAELLSSKEQLIDRSMLVKKAKRINVECVIRGYLAGSAAKEYKEKGTVCDIPLPSGLQVSQKLPEPIFTPAMKAMSGHDINISEQQVIDNEGYEVAQKLKEYSFALYNTAVSYAEKLGIIIADTKFEFGLIDNQIILIDEALTPDSSRFWEKEYYAVGKPQENFDKQIVRDYLESIGWDKQPPIPELPPEIVKKTQDKYWQVFRRLTEKNK